jgi:hypothetical protein
MPSAYKNNTNKNEINVIFLLTLCAFSGKLYPVSERKNNMKRREAHFAKGEAERDRRFAIALKKMKNSA